MANKTFILILVLVGVFSFSAGAQQQHSAQATMRVSVKVVSGASVEAVNPSVVSLTEAKKSDLGELKINGAQSNSTLVSVAKMLTLKNSEGKQLNLEIASNVNGVGESSNIRLTGSTNQNGLSGIYQGDLTTTIEYF